MPDPHEAENEKEEVVQGSLAAVTGSALDPDLKLKKNYVRKETTE